MNAGTCALLLVCAAASALAIQDGDVAHVFAGVYDRAKPGAFIARIDLVGAHMGNLTHVMDIDGLAEMETLCDIDAEKGLFFTTGYKNNSDQQWLVVADVATRKATIAPTPLAPNRVFRALSLRFDPNGRAGRNGFAKGSTILIIRPNDTTMCWEAARIDITSGKEVEVVASLPFSTGNVFYEEIDFDAKNQIHYVVLGSFTERILYSIDTSTSPTHFELLYSNFPGLKLRYCKDMRGLLFFERHHATGNDEKPYDIGILHLATNTTEELSPAFGGTDWWLPELGQRSLLLPKPAGGWIWLEEINQPDKSPILFLGGVDVHTGELVYEAPLYGESTTVNILGFAWMPHE